MQGIEAVSVQWGAWESIGMAASDSNLLKKLARQGYKAIQPAAGLSALSTVLTGLLQEGGKVMASGFDWSTFLQGKPLYPPFKDVVQAGSFWFAEWVVVRATAGSKPLRH